MAMSEEHLRTSGSETERLYGAIASLLEKAGEAAELAPEAGAHLVSYTHTAATVGVVAGALAVVAAIFLARFGIGRYRLASEINKAKDERYSRDEEISAATAGVVSLVLSAILGISGAVAALVNITPSLEPAGYLLSRVLL